MDDTDFGGHGSILNERAKKVFPILGSMGQRLLYGGDGRLLSISSQCRGQGGIRLRDKPRQAGQTPSPLAYYLVYRAESREQPAVRAFCAWLRREAAAQSA